MLGYSDTTHNEKLYEILLKVGFLLNERKTRQKYISEMFKALRDIEFIENKIFMARKNLSVRTNEVKDIETQIITSNEKKSVLQKEREIVEARYLKFKKIENDLQTKRQLLPRIEADISQSEQQVNALLTRVNMLKAKKKESLAKKEKLNIGSIKLLEKIDALLIEIPIMKNTRDVLTGLMPTGVDENSFEMLKGDFDKNLQEYLEEMNEQIGKITQTVSNLKTQIKAEKEKELSIKSESASLKKKLENISREVGEHHNKDELIARFNKMHERNEYLTHELSQMREEIYNKESELENIDQTLVQEQKTNVALSQKYSTLKEIKQKMDTVEDMNAEVDRLNKQVKLFFLEEKINEKLHEIVSQIHYELNSTNHQLELQIDSYNQQVNEMVEKFL